MTTETFEFPTPTPTDPPDVAAAIQTAESHWRAGSSTEALQCLKQAAETAEEQGDDLRALTLARTAADLKDLLGIAPSVPPAGQSAPPQPQVASQPQVAPEESGPPTTASRAPAPPSATTTPLQPWPPLPPTNGGSPLSAGPASVTPSDPAPNTPKITPAQPAIAPAVLHHALRVSVEGRDPAGSLLVRVLGDGDPVGINAREALLVPLQPGVDLRQGRER